MIRKLFLVATLLAATCAAGLLFGGSSVVPSSSAMGQNSNGNMNRGMDRDMDRRMGRRRRHRRHERRWHRRHRRGSRMANANR
jgi:heme O synthase-like polyprenyltransferase